MPGLGRPCGEASVLRLLADELAQAPAGAGALLMPAGEVAALFDAAAHDAAPGEDKEEDVEEEEGGAEEEGEEAGGGGALDGRLRGRRLDSAGARTVLVEVCRRAVARVSEVAPAGSPLPALVDERLRDCLEDAVAEAAAAGPQTLRQFRDNALGCVYDTLHRIFAQ
jgi:hypothetical protein